MRDTQMTTRVAEGAKKERLPAKPEKIVLYGLVIFWRENLSVDRPST